MQEKNARRKNVDRSTEMRAKLLAAARTLFVQSGYTETSTPDIARAADVTRGALYHHFSDKAALFQAVVEAEADALRQEIDAGSMTGDNPLADGSRAFFKAMSVPGRARILLVDGPGLLGWRKMAEIDAGGGRAALRDGLGAVLDLEDQDLDALAAILSAGFDAAALAISDGAESKPYEAAFNLLMASLTA